MMLTGMQIKRIEGDLGKLMDDTHTKLRHHEGNFLLRLGWDFDKTNQQTHWQFSGANDDNVPKTLGSNYQYLIGESKKRFLLASTYVDVSMIEPVCLIKPNSTGNKGPHLYLPTLSMNWIDVILKKGKVGSRARCSNWAKTPHTIIHTLRFSKRKRHK